MDLHQICVNTIKGLAMDGVQKANSGHPGMPMGMADVATVLWTRFLKHDPADARWPDRDRFVLSAGHGSMLLYSLLHLSGYRVTLDDLKQFRQFGSITPGHPEHGETDGVETTTGPLGQGFANGVGMAIAERILRETFGPELVDHFVYAIVSDGDLMEGVAAEAASVAGHLRLGRLIYLYDANRISIDGSTDLAFTEDVGARFEAYGWHVLDVDGHDADAIANAISIARNVTARPSLIVCRTLIGKGSATLEGSEKTHGAPLGPTEIAATKKKLGMDPDVTFWVPDQAVTAFRAHDGPARRAAWEARMAEHPRAAELRAWLAGDPEAVIAAAKLPTFEPGGKIATRKSSQAVLKALCEAAPWLVGGSADLTESNGMHTGLPDLTREHFAGRPVMHFGVREHGAAAIANGMILHGGVRPFVGTFLVFHDYQRPSVRMAAIMHQGTIFIYSHDSVFLGEDGPTHQPIATLAAMRALPNVHVLRPGDAHETAASWRYALRRRTGPTCIVVTRQALPTQPAAADRDADFARGGYILLDANGTPDVVLCATGSEVSLAVAARHQLEEAGVHARVVTLPCVEQFLAQSKEYRASVLGTGIPRVSIEAAATFGWERIVGEHGLAIGIDRYGWSAPAEVIAEKIGFTPGGVAVRVRAFLGR